MRRAVHDDVDTLFAQTALEYGIEFELTRQYLLDCALGFNVEVDVAAQRVVPDT